MARAGQFNRRTLTYAGSISGEHITPRSPLLRYVSLHGNHAQPVSRGYLVALRLIVIVSGSVGSKRYVPLLKRLEGERLACGESTWQRLAPERSNMRVKRIITFAVTQILLYSNHVSANPHDRDSAQQRLLLYVSVRICGFSRK